MSDQCDNCGAEASGFYCLHEYDQELETTVTTAGLYLCDTCLAEFRKTGDWE